MGKDKSKGERTKTHPIGSSMLRMGSGTESRGLLAGFSSLLAAEGSDDSLPSELAVALKKLYKSSAVTRMKGLKEISDLFICSEDANEAEKAAVAARREDESYADAVLNALTQAFPRLTTDPERPVREKACSVLGAVISSSRVVQKCLGRHVVELLPPWLCAMNDSAHDVAVAAHRAFAVIPAAGRSKAMLAARENIVEYIGELLNSAFRGLPPPCHQQTGVHLDDAIKEDFVERSMVTGLGALTALVKASAAAQKEDGVKCFACFFGGATPLLSWKKMFKHKSAACRKAAYDALATLAEMKIPELFYGALDGGDGAVNELHTIVFQSLADRDPSTHSAMWRCVISWIGLFGDSAWKAVTPILKKATFPALFALMRMSCFGSVDVSYEQLPRFLMLIPDSQLSESGFFKCWMDSLWTGVFQSTTTPGMLGVVTTNGCKCIADCLLYVLGKLHSSPSIFSDAQEEVSRFIDDCFVSFAAAVLYDSRASHVKKVLDDAASAFGKMDEAEIVRIAPRLLQISISVLQRTESFVVTIYQCNKHKSKELLSPKHAADMLLAVIAPRLGNDGIAKMAMDLLREPTQLLLSIADAESNEAAQVVAKTFNIPYDISSELIPIIERSDDPERVERFYDMLISSAAKTADWGSVVNVMIHHPVLLLRLLNDKRFPTCQLTPAALLQCFSLLESPSAKAVSNEDAAALEQLIEDFIITEKLSTGEDEQSRNGFLSRVVEVSKYLLEKSSTSPAMAQMACSLLVCSTQMKCRQEEEKNQAIATLLFYAGNTHGRFNKISLKALEKVKISNVTRKLLEKVAAQRFSSCEEMANSLQSLSDLATRCGCWEELAEMSAELFRVLFAPFCRVKALKVLPCIWSRNTIAPLSVKADEEEKKEEPSDASPSITSAVVALLVTVLARTNTDFEKHTDLVAYTYISNAVFDCNIGQSLLRDAAFYAQQTCDSMIGPLLEQCPSVLKVVLEKLIAASAGDQFGVIAAHAAQLLPQRTDPGKEILNEFMKKTVLDNILSDNSTCYIAQCLIALNVTKDDFPPVLLTMKEEAISSLRNDRASDDLSRCRALSLIRALHTAGIKCEKDNLIVENMCALLAENDPLVTSLAAVVIFFVQNPSSPLPSFSSLQKLTHYCSFAMNAGDFYIRSVALRIAMDLLQKNASMSQNQKEKDEDGEEGFKTELEKFDRICAGNVTDALASFDTDPVPKPGIQFYGNTLYNVFADMWQRNADCFLQAGTLRQGDLLDCLMVIGVPKLQFACSMILSHVFSCEAKGLQAIECSAAAASAPPCLKRAMDALSMTLVRGCSSYAHMLLWNIVHEVFRATPLEWVPAFVALLRESGTFDHHMRVITSELTPTAVSSNYPAENPLLKITTSSMSTISFDDLAKIVHETAAWQMLQAMQWFPTVMRSWSINCSDKALSAQVQSWTSAASRRLKEIAFPDGNAYSCSCEMDDVVVIECTVFFPPLYPLEPLSMNTNAGSGTMVRKWHLLLHTMLSHGEECGWRDNSYIVNTVKRWQESIEKHYENVEPCPVCYSIFSPDGRLPKMMCRTCHHKYHTSCMARWFSTSHKTVCPMCKSDFTLRS